MNYELPNTEVNLGELNLSTLFFAILGPCVIESEELTLRIAEELRDIQLDLGIPIIFKASFDKANRTSIESYRGPGLRRGLEILERIREKTGLPILSDIHTPDQAKPAGLILDVIQIPAFLSRQTDLLMEAAKTGRVINIKKGQFQSPDDMEHAINKVVSSGNTKILLTERGSTFGYNDLVSDMRSIPRLKKFGFPVIFDATHSAQFPGRGSSCSGGDRGLVPVLAQAAVAAGADGIFMEVHPEPESALCDGPNSLELSEVKKLLNTLKQIRTVVTEGLPPELRPNPENAARSFGLNDLNMKLQKIKLLVLDVDGVLTDGKIVFGSGNLEIKSFHVRDGHGIKIAIRTGLEIALVTGRSSEVVSRRALELGIERVYQGMKDKKPALAQLVEDLGITNDQVAVMGDDVVDIPLMRRAGFSFTVPEAPDAVRVEADYVTKAAGGNGAAREIIDMILKAQGKSEEALARYYV